MSCFPLAVKRTHVRSSKLQEMAFKVLVPVRLICTIGTAGLPVQ